MIGAHDIRSLRQALDAAGKVTPEDALRMVKALERKIQDKTRDARGALPGNRAERRRRHRG